MVWHLTNPGNWASIWSAKCVFFGPKKIPFMQTESVLQTKNRSEPAKNRFSVALSQTIGATLFILVVKVPQPIVFDLDLCLCWHDTTRCRGIFCKISWYTLCIVFWQKEIKIPCKIDVKPDIIWAMSWQNLFMPYANNKGAGQPAHPRSLISAFVAHFLDSVIPLVSISQI